MKKNRLFIAALCAAAGITACNTAPEKPEVSEFTLTVDASLPAPDTKGLALSGKTLNAVWATGDKVIVLNGSTNIGTLTPQSTGSATASLKGTITGSVSVGQTLTLQTPRESWLYNTNQDGTLSTVAKNFAYARANITVTAVSGNTISAEPAHFENQQAIVKFILKDDKGATLCADELTIESSSNKLVRAKGASTSYGSITIEPDDEEEALYAALRNESGAADTYTITATVGKNTYTCKKSGVLFENGKYYSVTATMASPTANYCIAGTPQAIFGGTKDWDEQNTDYMTKQADGTYVKSYTVTKTTDIAFKVVLDNSWDTAWPQGDNYTATVGAGTLKIVFDPSTTNITATYADPGVVTKTYTVAGDSEGDDTDTDAVFGTAWDPANTSNDMSLVSGTLYKKTYNNVKGGTQLAFKVCENHAWTISYGQSGGNYVYNVKADKNVTISFDSSTKAITVTEN